MGAHEAAQGDQRQDVEALQTAVLGLVSRGPGGPRVTRNGGGIGSPLRPMLQVTLGPADLTAGARQDPSKPLLDDLRVVPSAVDHAQLPSFEAETAIFTVSALKSGGFLSTAREEPAACQGYVSYSQRISPSEARLSSLSRPQCRKSMTRHPLLSARAFRSRRTPAPKDRKHR